MSTSNDSSKVEFIVKSLSYELFKFILDFFFIINKN